MTEDTKLKRGEPIEVRLAKIEINERVKGAEKLRAKLARAQKIYKDLATEVDRVDGLLLEARDRLRELQDG